MSKVFNQYSKFYDEIYKEKEYVLEAKFIKGVIKTYSSFKAKNILSVGCGTCNHEMILAKEGYAITGLDQSQTMLDLGRKKISKAGLTDKITLIKQDARSFKPNNKFDAAMELFNVIGYHTTNEDINKVLGNINRSLKTDSIFFFDCWYLPAVLKDRPTDRIKEIVLGEKRLLRITRSKLQINKNIIEIEFHLMNIKKNIVIEETKEIHSIRYWSLPELKYILNANNFKIIKVGNFLDIDTPPSENNWHIFVIVQKR